MNISDIRSIGYCGYSYLHVGGLLVAIDHITAGVGCVIGGFVVPSQRRSLAKGRLVDTKCTDGTKRIFVCDVVPIHPVNVRGAVAFIQVASVAIVIDPVVNVPA